VRREEEEEKGGEGMVEWKKEGKWGGEEG